MKHIRMSGIGSVLPGEPVPFEEINQYLGNFQNAPAKLMKWVERMQPVIHEMLGIEYCHYAFDKESREFTDDNLTLSVKAAQKAMKMAGIKPEDVELLIYGGAYSYQIPPISTRIQEELGIERCAELHIHANCTSVYKGIMLAHTLLRCGEYKNALVISSSVASSCFMPEFYNQEVLTKDDIFLRWYLCDGAGAMMFTAEDEPRKGFYLEDCYMESAGGYKQSAMYNELPSHWNNPLEDYRTGAHHIRQIYLSDMKEYALEPNGKTIFYNALERMIQCKNLDLNHLSDFVVNMPSKFVREYIMDECLQLGIPMEKFYSAVEECGYAGPPAAIISIDRLLQKKTFQPGDLVLSFVMEVSKFMQAGFTLRCCE